MPKYNCTVIFDASSTVTVEADTPEEAAEIAQDQAEGNQHLCHQCSDTLETGDAIGVHVYDEACTEHLLDTTYQPPQPKREPLTDEQIVAGLEAAGVEFHRFMGGIGGDKDIWATSGSQSVQKIAAGVRAMFAVHGIKE
mgnify:CR=1 FL=1